MDVKFTPWRMAYIAGPKVEGCVFCQAAAGTDDAATYVVARGRNCFVVLNTFPYNNGHLMILPYAHLSELSTLPSETFAELWELTRMATSVLLPALHPQGFNVGLNLGKVAGAGIADHLHMHVVPRWNGDTNYMAAIGQTRLIPQSLEETWRILHEAWPGA